jgi:hypothetical protein
MDCRVPQSGSLVMERPGPSSLEILSPENFSTISGKVLDGRDGPLGCLEPVGWNLPYAVAIISACIVDYATMVCSFDLQRTRILRA